MQRLEGKDIRVFPAPPYDGTAVVWKSRRLSDCSALDRKVNTLEMARTKYGNLGYAGPKLDLERPTYELKCHLCDLNAHIMSKKDELIDLFNFFEGDIFI